VSDRRSAYIGLERALFQSRAWLSLSGVAPQVYLLLAGRVRKEKPTRHAKQWRVLNNGKLEFTYLEAEHKYGISSPRFTRAISQLVEHGFIDINHSGGGLGRDRSLYALVERWRQWGAPEFKTMERPKGRRWTLPKTDSTNENVVL